MSTSAPREGAPRQRFDLAVVGSGIACTHTLAAFLDGLPSQAEPLRIAVIEQDGQFWRGYPYGRRSSPNSLIITTLDEFVPDEERAEFCGWLKDRRKAWVRNLAEQGGKVAENWLSENRAAIAADDLGKTYIPRQLYGDFAEARMRKTIAEAQASNKAIVTEIVGEALDLERLDPGYRLTFEHDGRASTLDADLMLIATGSPPFRALAGADECAARDAGCYVNNAYLPGLVENLNNLARRLRATGRPEDRNLLIVGSNATSLEVLYMLSRDPDLRALLNKVVVLSTSGMLPHRMAGGHSPVQSFPKMQALLAASSLTPRDIIGAVEADLEATPNDVPNRGDIFHKVSELLVQLLAKLDDAAQREFHHSYGMRFTRLVRRAGADYRDAAQDLLACGKLDLVAGRFIKLVPDHRGRGVQVFYEDTDGSTTHPLSFAVALNCTGFEEVSAHSSSPFLAALVARKLVRVNPTGRGLDVDETFAAGPNLFACGPLLGGVFNTSFRYWHVENVRRIHAMAAVIGPALVLKAMESKHRAEAQL